MDDVEVIKQKAKTIRSQVKNHSDWPAFVDDLRDSCQKNFGRDFTEAEIINALDLLFDSYDPNVSGEVDESGSDESSDANPFWSLTKLDKKENVVALFITDSDDINAFTDFLLRDPDKELQNSKLEAVWKVLKNQSPAQVLLPKLIFFAYLQSDLNVSTQARTLLSHLKEFNDIESLYRKFVNSNNKFILSLKSSLGLAIEEILDLCFIENGHSFSNTFFEIVRTEKLKIENMPLFSKIESLSIDWSKMDEHAFSCFAFLQNIQTLNVYTYTRHSFPDQKIKSDSMRRLSVSGRLKSLTPDISLFTGLEKLKISQLKLTALPSTVFHLPQLTSLDANGNLFESLPDIELSKLKVQKLNLMFNNIAEIPSSWSSLSELRQLLLSNNELRAIPEFIRQLTKLEKLDLGNNKITALPLWIAKLEGLTELYCSANAITNIPNEILQLKNLQVLDLRFNPIMETQVNELRTRLPNTAILA